MGSKRAARLATLGAARERGAGRHDDERTHRRRRSTDGRVAIARALATDPKVVLFDEVTPALDPELIGEVLAVMRQLAASDGVTTIVVTSEMLFARDAADRIVFMDHGGVVGQRPPTPVPDRPRSERLRAFLSRICGTEGAGKSGQEG